MGIYKGDPKFVRGCDHARWDAFQFGRQGSHAIHRLRIRGVPKESRPLCFQVGLALKPALGLIVGVCELSLQIRYLSRCDPGLFNQSARRFKI